MKTETNTRQQLHSRSSHLPARPGSRTYRIPPHIASSVTRLSRGSIDCTLEIMSPQQKSYHTCQRSKDARYGCRIWRKCRNLKRQGKIGWKRKTRSSQFDTYNEESGSVALSDTCVGSAELSPTTSSSRTLGTLDNIKSHLSIGESKHPVKLLGEAEQDTALLQHHTLKQSELEKRNIATERYRVTGNVNVFAPFMAPFLGGPNKPDLGPWVWEQSVERWRREHKLNGEIVWGPTDDSFI